MADKTKIEWTEATWNPIRARLRSDPARVGWHCEHASPGCEHCYSEARNLSGRCNLGTRLPFKPGHRADVDVYLDEAVLLQPLRWRRPRLIFPCSMTDLFGAFVSDDMLDRIFAVMALCPQHTFQVLTKRSARMREYLCRRESDWPMAWGAAASALSLRPRDLRPDEQGRLLMRNYGPFPLPNVWLGVSVEDQQRADERVPDLLATPAAVRWLSCEPLLGPVSLAHIAHPVHEGSFIDALDGYTWGYSSGPFEHRSPLNWIVAGGESGPKARPMHPAWARSLRDQCASAGVPFFFKQWGEWAPEADHPGSFGKRAADLMPDGTRVVHPNAMTAAMVGVGKKRAGRLLDGVEHSAMPAHG